MELLKQIALLVAIVLIVLLISGVLYQRINTRLDEERFPPFGERVDIGGYKLHIHCSGEGRDTVLLDAGMGSNSLEWSLVQPEIAKFAHVCSLDRPGNGYSDESPLVRTSENIVREFHTLLERKSLKGPYILVGHSFGGINMLLFAVTYPNEVKGVVLVDSSHEDQLRSLPPLPQPPATLTKFLSMSGVIRFLNQLPEQQKGYHAFPESVQKRYPATLSKDSYIRTVIEEVRLFPESLNQLKGKNLDLGDTPLVVITAGKSMKGVDLGLSDGGAKEITEKWRKLQKDLTRKSSQSKQVFADKSGHLITREQPEIIVEAVKELVIGAGA